MLKLFIVKPLLVLLFVILLVSSIGVTRLVPNLELIQRNVETTLEQGLPMLVGNQHRTTLRDGNDSAGDDAESVVIEFDSHNVFSWLVLLFDMSMITYGRDTLGQFVLLI